LLNQPDQRTSLGSRDYALLLFLYNSGARADEAAKLTIANLQLGAPSSVRLHGKGNKFRTCPLWPTTATSLSRLVVDRNKTDAVFLNRVNQPLTRFGIHRVVTQYGDLASRTVPSLATKRLSRSSSARRRRHQHDPSLARPRVAGYDSYLRGSRHGNEGQGIGKCRYHRLQRSVPATGPSVPNGVSRSAVKAMLVQFMLRIGQGKTPLSLAPSRARNIILAVTCRNISADMLAITYQPVLLSVPSRNSRQGSHT
jgi:hypothetical protein